MIRASAVKAPVGRNPGAVPVPLQVAGVREAIRARGAELRYLPPYAPELDPIAQAFADLEAPRKAAERTVDGLRTVTGRLLERLAPSECANDPASSGYPRSA